MSKEELVAAIGNTERQLAAAVVHSCEIYSRVVGYYRPVNQWNVGKQEEWKVRAKFDTSVGSPA